MALALLATALTSGCRPSSETNTNRADAKSASTAPGSTSGVSVSISPGSAKSGSAPSEPAAMALVPAELLNAEIQMLD
ncbi:MAG: hypothetical protein WKF30_16180, partial [Pyrinomonadaceae bacterium]